MRSSKISHTLHFTFRSNSLLMSARTCDSTCPSEPSAVGGSSREERRDQEAAPSDIILTGGGESLCQGLSGLQDQHPTPDTPRPAPPPPPPDSWPPPERPRR